MGRLSCGAAFQFFGCGLQAAAEGRGAEFGRQAVKDGRGFEGFQEGFGGMALGYHITDQRDFAEGGSGGFVHTKTYVLAGSESNFWTAFF